MTQVLRFTKARILVQHNQQNSHINYALQLHTINVVHP
jgi:hypothetical protein